jgi:hypothetical protein
MVETYLNQTRTSQQATLTRGTNQFRILLAISISMQIEQLIATGGPTGPQAQAVTSHLDYAQATPLPLLSDGEHPTMRQIARTLAILSFIPGGIFALGLYCQASANPPVVPYDCLCRHNVNAT